VQPRETENAKHGHNDAPRPSAGQNGVVPQPGRLAAENRRSESASSSGFRSVFELHQLLERHPDLPPHAAVLGVCEDGLPILLDLADPVPGAVISIGDEREVQLQLLRTAVSSLVTRNTPRSVQFIVISHQPETWKTWIQERGFDRYCLAVEGGDDQSVRDWVLRLADWTEQRRMGQRGGPPVLVVMDTLSFLLRLPYDVRLNFEWMVKEGPPAQIWPLAAISTELAKSLGVRCLRSFQTRLLGFSQKPEAYVDLAGIAENDVECFRQPGEFGVQVAERWLRFRPL
jgi:hypothetical protein